MPAWRSARRWRGHRAHHLRHAIAPIYAQTTEEFARKRPISGVSGGRFQFGIGVAPAAVTHGRDGR
jgi:hypothetical protein